MAEPSVASPLTERAAALDAAIAAADSADDSGPGDKTGTADSEADSQAQPVEAFDALIAKAWSDLPFGLRVATFADGDPQGFGKYRARETSTYRSGETLIVYAEPVGYGFRDDNGTKTFDISADYALYTPVAQERRPLVEAKDAFVFERSSTSPTREFFAVARFAFGSIRSGEYILEITFHDRVGKQSTKLELPFSIVE